MNITKLWALAVLAGLSACNETANGSRDATEDAPASEEDSVYTAVGQLTDMSDSTVTIAHGPVPELGWPAMTMAFEADSSAQIHGLAVGDRVSFSFREIGTGYALISVEKVSS